MKTAISIAAVLIFLGGIFLIGFNSRREDSGFVRFLPDEINGWEAKGPDMIYDPETIFDYIDGAGEVYRAYNFKKLFVRRYGKQGRPDIVADCFDMGSSHDAFGVFTHDLEGEDSGIGQGSAYSAGLLSFWKSHFFISLYTEEETPETKEAVLSLGRKIAESVSGEGSKPDLIRLFPADGFNEQSVHYFHNHLVLNYHFFVADENILLLDQQTEAALGTYRDNEEKYRLLIIRYLAADKAAEAYKIFIQNYMPDAKAPGLVKTEDGKWTAARVEEEFLIIAFDCPTDSSALHLMEGVEKKLDTKKDNNQGGGR